MIIGIVLILGAVVGYACYKIYGSGYGLWTDISLGVAGYIIASAIMTTAYVWNGFNKEDVIGLNWYSMVIGVAGALAVIYGGLIYRKSNLLNINISKTRLRPVVAGLNRYALGAFVKL
jgi:uncharacterized membrane protein YeaQ/YmgE (transglycosylase-associated protein family)